MEAALEASRMQHAAAGRGGAGGRGSRHGGPSDDLDVWEEEQEEAARLSALLPALREEAAREKGGGGGRWGATRERGDWQPRSAGEQLREAQSRLARLKASTAGPPDFEPAVEVRGVTPG